MIGTIIVKEFHARLRGFAGKVGLVTVPVGRLEDNDWTGFSVKFKSGRQVVQ